MHTFSPEELKELAAYDRELDRTFVLTPQERKEIFDRDHETTRKWRIYYQRHKDAVLARNKRY